MIRKQQHKIHGMSKYGLALELACGLAFLVASAPNACDAQEATKLAETLEAIVQDQAQAWNRGDIDGFMKAYWKSEQLTFCSGGEIERGWESTRKRYQQRYPDAKTMGKLTFSQLEVQSLGAEAALMLGRWRLDRDEPVGGNFSLVWRKFENGWRIIHDHTSADRQ